jgi:hypothetical protein
VVREVESNPAMKRADSKFAARNPKFETNPNVPNSNVFSLFAVFELFNFEFVSGFDIPISDFSTPKTCLVPAMPGEDESSNGWATLLTA